MKGIVNVGIGVFFLLLGCGGAEPELGSIDTDLSVVTLDHVHQGFGDGLNTREVIEVFTLPDDLSTYGKITMRVSQDCPTGGCDPWDRFSQISVIKDGATFEVGRVMTPYGIACSWDIDVSDYRSVLSGEVEIYSFIDTWVNPGWLTTVEFIYEEGNAEYEQIEVENIWVDYNVIYGDPARKPESLSIAKTITTDMKKMMIRVINTGHGQGNFENAAEFYPVTHHVLVGDKGPLDHFLWRDNCEENTCSPQNGNWRYPRAGWCPGADVIPADFDITSMVQGSGEISLAYELAPYTNSCRPDNPDCDGTTCAIGDDCEYNNQGHTEPHYKIAVQLFTYR